MIQDIFPHHLNNPYRPDARPEAGDFAVIYRNGAFLVDEDATDATIRFPRVGDIPGDCLKDPIYLFSVDDVSYFAFGNSDADPQVEVPGFSFQSLRQIRGQQLSPKETVYAIFTAYHLMEWYLSSRFCGHCGQRTEFDSTERAMRCPACGKKIYPRINPAVIVGVLNGDSILITRYRTGFANNALVAGFTEIGETLEETVQREVMEEAGLKVKNIRYYKSQPWGVAADILTGFYCDVDGDDTIRMDANELKYAEWVRRGDVVLQPTNYSLTNEMMKRFRDGLDC